jgi:alpha-tubulin suppressor-like RCC1 family protein
MEANNKVVDAALGEEFTIITTENKLNGETEVFGFGYNLRGELGAGFSRHLNDVVKIDSLSNYRI